MRKKSNPETRGSLDRAEEIHHQNAGNMEPRREYRRNPPGKRRGPSNRAPTNAPPTPHIPARTRFRKARATGVGPVVKRMPNRSSREPWPRPTIAAPVRAASDRLESLAGFPLLPSNRHLMATVVRRSRAGRSRDMNGFWAFKLLLAVPSPPAFLPGDRGTAWRPWGITYPAGLFEFPFWWVESELHGPVNPRSLKTHHPSRLN